MASDTDPKANLNITYVSHDTIRMEDPNDETGGEDKVVNAFDGKQSVIQCRLCGKSTHWTRFCPYRGTMGKGEAGIMDDDDGGREEEGKTDAKPTGTGYVPPHLRARGDARGGGDYEDASAPREEERYV